MVLAYSSTSFIFLGWFGSNGMKSAFRDEPTFSSLKEAETSSEVLKKVVALLLEPEKKGLGCNGLIMPLQF